MNLLLFFGIITIFSVEGCSIGGKRGTFAKHLFTTTDDNILHVGLETFDDKSMRLAPSNATLDLSTGTLIENEIELAYELTVPPEALEDASGDYSVHGSWPRYFLLTSDPEALPINVDFIEATTTARSLGYDVTHFVAMGMAYVIAANYDEVRVAIVNLSERTVVSYQTLPSDLDLYLSSDHVPLVYKDVQLVSLRGDSGLCTEYVYFYYNETSMAHRFSTTSVGAWNSLGAVGFESSLEEPTIFLLSQQEVTSVKDEFYSIPGLATVTEKVISTGEELRTVDFDLDNFQIPTEVENPTPSASPTITRAPAGDVKNGSQTPVTSQPTESPASGANSLSLSQATASVALLWTTMIFS